MQLFFKVEGQCLFLAKKETVVADSINYLTAGVGFSEKDWDGLEKWMHFTLGDKHYVINLIDDQITADRGVNLCAGDWTVYIHGNIIENGETKQRITTNKIWIKVLETGDLDGEPFPDIPPSSGEQIIAQTIAARDAAIASATAAKGSEDRAATSERGAAASAQFADAAADQAQDSAANAANSSEEASGHADRAKRFADLALQDIEDKEWMYLEGRDDGHLYMVTSDAQTDISIKDNGEGRLVVVYA